METFSSKTFSSSEAAALLDVIRHRRDVRGNRFLSRPIEDGVVDQILEAALHAPSVGFSQPWEFVLITETATKEQIKNSFIGEKASSTPKFPDEKQATYARLKLEGIIEAPLNMAVFYKPSGKPVLGQTSMEEAGWYSVVCAIQNMWLMARALNVGIGWVSILDPEEVKRVLNAPPDNKLVAYLCLGYTDGFYAQPELELLEWERRKERPALVIRERYITPSVNF